MTNYKTEFKEFRWTFWHVFGVVVLAGIILTGISFSLNALGVFGTTVVERKVFEHSYQRSEALKSQIANDTAVLTEIERKLSNPKLDPATRTNLEAQASAARIRIATAKGKQK